MPVAEAFERVAEWIALPHVRVLTEAPAHFARLRGILEGIGTAGNLSTDAHLAVIAIVHDATLCSADADFSRFPGLRWTNPLAASKP